MRTRTSPRNQEILFRALTPPPAPKLKALPAVQRCWDCASYPKGGRARGECTLMGLMVNGRSHDRHCFMARKP